MAQGKKTGGRQKGSKNKAPTKAALAQEVAGKAVAAGVSPLEYMLSVMRDPVAEPAVRLDASKAAAPYVHPKLSAVEHTGKDGGPIQIEYTL